MENLLSRPWRSLVHLAIVASVFISAMAYLFLKDELEDAIELRKAADWQKPTSLWPWLRDRLIRGASWCWDAFRSLKKAIGDPHDPERNGTAEALTYVLVALNWTVRLTGYTLLLVVALVLIVLNLHALLSIPLYLFARVYIIVEAFASLRHVSVGVYEQVTWAQYLPHL